MKGAGMQGAIGRLCERAEAAVAGGYNIIILSDRQVGPDIAIPALLATARCITSDPQAAHRLASSSIRRAARSASFLLPCRLAPRRSTYLAFDTLLDMHKRGELPKEVDAYEVVSRYIKSIGKGILR